MEVSKYEFVKEKNMSNKTTVILYGIASLLFYITALIKFFNTGFSSGVVWFCFGSVFFCIGESVRHKKEKSDDKDTFDKKNR